LSDRHFQREGKWRCGGLRKSQAFSHPDSGLETCDPLAPAGKLHPPKGFIELYYHSNPVRFRNIWVRPIEVPE
jgi:hypothetical protein